MITHGNKQISEIVYARKASEGGGAVRLTNIIRGAQVVFGGMSPSPSSWGWLDVPTVAAILAAFGVVDGKAVIKATNAYLNAIAAQGQAGKDKATALAALINEDLMMVCSLGLEPQGVTMPIRWIDNGGSALLNTGYKRTSNTKVTFDLIAKTSNDTAFMGTRGSAYLFYNFGSNYFWPISKCDSITGTLVVGNVYHVEWDGTSFVATGTDGVRQTAARNIGAQTSDMYVFNFNPINGRWANAKIAYFKIEESGVLQKHFIPFKHNDNGTVIDCFLDLAAVGVEGATIFYYNANTSGSFTIAYTLPDGTPWTPLNQTP